MKLGWLWLSILNTTASPSPMSMTPAFSPGPWITQGALVGSVRRWIFEDLYEQCSFHIAEKTPSSVKLGSRPISLTMRSYSSGLRPCSAISSGVMAGSLEITAAFSSVMAGLIPAIHVLIPACKVVDARHKAYARSGQRPAPCAGHDGVSQAAFA